MTRKALALAVLGTSLALASLSSQETTIKLGGSIVAAISTEPDHLDPYQATSADSRAILFNIFEGLVKPNEDGELVPAVAAELPTVSPDFLTYTFKVRKGLKFQNGAAVTAADVKYSLETAAASKTVSGLGAVKSVAAPDASTVVIALSAPDNDFLPYLTVAVVPKDYKDQNTAPIGTGPFAFESFKPQQALVLKKNAYYWKKGFPRLDKVTFKLEADTNAILLDLQAGNIDFASIAADAATQQLAASYSIQQKNSNAVQQLNLNQAFKPFADLRVRQALSYAVDPDEIIAAATFGRGTRVGSPIIPGLKAYFDPALNAAYKKDLAKAKSLLAEAGYAGGLAFTITVPSNYKVHVDTAQVIVEELKAIGVAAEIVQVDWPTWISKVYQGRDYQATIISVDGANLSPKSFLARYVTGASGNFFNYSSKEFDDAYAKAGKEPSPQKRVALYKSAQAILSRDAANVYIQDIASLQVLKKGLAGLQSYPLYVTDVSGIYYTK
jgi:peptide/nickel transport system substrate-binding protein